MITGKKAEEVFADLMTSLGLTVRGVTEEEDMFEHIDFFVDEESYDVKGHKRIGRHARYDKDVIWIERTNVKGNKGWLFGSAKYIVFLIADEFWVIDRLDLVKYVEDEIPYKAILSKKGYKTWYRRKDRLDCVTYVYPDDIEKLVKKRYKV